MFEALRVRDQKLVRLGAINAAGNVDYDEAKRACETRELVCPGCELFGVDREIYPRRGYGTPGTPGYVRPHWAHTPDDDLTCFAETHAMSVAHRLAQLHIRETLERRYPGCVFVEQTRWGLTEGAGRADVEVRLSDARLCIEVQRSAMSAADVQGRGAQREDAGWALDWVFVVDGHDDWSEPLTINSTLRTALEQRGYIYVLEDPLAEEPVLQVVVHPDLNPYVRWRGARAGLRRLPGDQAHVLSVSRPLSEFVVVAAGLRHRRLHSLLAGWIKDGLADLAPKPFEEPDPTTDEITEWQRTHDALERVLEEATAAADKTELMLRGSEREAQAALHAAEAALEATAGERSAPKATIAERAKKLLSTRRRRELAEHAAEHEATVAAATAYIIDEIPAALRRAREPQQRAERNLDAHQDKRAAATQRDDEANHARIEAARTRHENVASRQAPTHMRLTGWLRELAQRSSDLSTSAGRAPS